MPTISLFFGIAIRMYFREHGPPHFHAIYAGEDATIAIETLQVIEGRLSRRALNLVLDWAESHQAELMENWKLAREHELLKTIKPLE
jgi:hypothetical protein